MEGTFWGVSPRFGACGQGTWLCASVGDTKYTGLNRGCTCPVGRFLGEFCRRVGPALLCWDATTIFDSLCRDTASLELAMRRLE